MMLKIPTMTMPVPMTGGAKTVMPMRKRKKQPTMTNQSVISDQLQAQVEQSKANNDNDVILLDDDVRRKKKPHTTSKKPEASAAFVHAVAWMILRLRPTEPWKD